MTPHIVPLIGQQKTMGCWAAGFAMMHSWKLSSTIPISATLQKLGEPYISVYSGNTGLDVAKVSAALVRLNLTREPPQNPTAGRWRDLVGGGPLFVVVDENPHPGLFAVHARVIFDIKGDAVSTVHFNDPGANNLNGEIRTQPLADFVRDYEQLANTNWIGMQIIHF